MLLSSFFFLPSLCPRLKLRVMPWQVLLKGLLVCSWHCWTDHTKQLPHCHCVLCLSSYCLIPIGILDPGKWLLESSLCYLEWCTSKSVTKEERIMLGTSLQHSPNQLGAEFKPVFQVCVTIKGKFQFWWVCFVVIVWFVCVVFCWAFFCECVGVGAPLWFSFQNSTAKPPVWKIIFHIIWAM